MTREDVGKLVDRIRFAPGQPTGFAMSEDAAIDAVLAALSSAPPDPLYDPAFGDEKLCACGHPYYRHFDTYDQMRATGCKYCGCDNWTAPAPPVAETPEVLPPSGYKSPMQRHYETPEFKAAWAAGKAERDAIASPVVAPAPVVEEAPYCERHGTMCANDEMGRLWSCDCQTAEPCPCGNGYVYTPNHVSPRETPDGGGR